MDTFGRNYRVQIYRPSGQPQRGQWVSGREGYGTLVDRLERVARDILAGEEAGSFARVFRYVPHSALPMAVLFALRMPGEVGPIPPLPSASCECTGGHRGARTGAGGSRLATSARTV